MSDVELLREYADSKSETAFQKLVERYVPLVYSAAFRQVGDPTLAEDITQVVFIILARKAGKFSEKTLLAGWLYRTTRHTAARALRNEHRRRRREQEAFLMQTAETNTYWERLAPFLDEAMAELSELDRGAVLLRYFQNKSLWEVGQALGLNEDAAQKRVSRAIAKLRRLLLKRGVSVSAVVVTGLLATHAAQIAPETLATSVTAAALSKASMSTPVYALLEAAVRQSLWPKLAAVGAVAGAAAILATTLVYFWPQPSRGASSYSFDSRIVTHPRLGPGPPAEPESAVAVASAKPVAEPPNAPPEPASKPAIPTQVAISPAAPVWPPGVITNASPPTVPLLPDQIGAGQVPDVGGIVPLAANPNWPLVTMRQPYPYVYGAGDNNLVISGPAQTRVTTNAVIWAPTRVWMPVQRVVAPVRTPATRTPTKK